MNAEATQQRNIQGGDFLIQVVYLPGCDDAALLSLRGLAGSVSSDISSAADAHAGMLVLA